VCNKNQVKIGSRGVLNTTCSKECANKHPNRIQKIIKNTDYKERNAKTKRTCKAKYGAENIFQTTHFKEKRAARLQVLGVSNISQLPETKAKVRDTLATKYAPGTAYYKERRKKLQKKQSKTSYAVNWNSNKDDILQEWQNGESPIVLSQKYNVAFSTIYKELVSQGLRVKYDTVSAPHKKLNNWLDEQGIEYRTNVRNVIAPKELDIFIPSLQVGIEINGIFWHSDQFLDKNYHLNKTKACEEKNIRLFHFTDEEILHSFDIVSSMLSNLLRQNDRVFARTCSVVEVSNYEYEEFCNKNHLQGSVKASVRYGLRHNNKLVMVMSFAKARFSNSYTWEIMRLCTLLNTTVVGGASKLLKYFLDNHEGDIITYANLRFSQGNAYKKLGFEFLHNSRPSYCYSDGKQTYSRYLCQKHKLSELLGEKYDPQLTEEENMLQTGYSKIWDCGNAVYGIRR